MPTPRPTPADPWRLRGSSPGRLENFSDCTFSLAITLLMFASEVPKTFDDLVRTLPGFFGFAASLAILSVLWRQHVLFFQRYGLSDRTTVVLNTALMAVLVFYVYPLKFLISTTVSLWGRALGKLAGMSGELLPEKALGSVQLPKLMALYLMGFGAVALVYALLYRHALRRRESLALSPYELVATQHELLVWAVTAATAGLGCAWCSVLGPVLAPYGALFMVVVPRLRRVLRKRRESLKA